jgi:hypothetical protein
LTVRVHRAYFSGCIQNKFPDFQHFSSQDDCSLPAMDGRVSALLLAVAFLTPAGAQDADELRYADAEPQQPSILVLVDGQVMAGSFIPRPDGYDVQVAGGRLYVESSRVRFVANDLNHAYQLMRSAHSKLTPEIHMEIARWCLNNHMPEQAKREVLDALKFDPNRADGRRMLQALTADVQSGEAPTAGSGVTEFSRAADLSRPAGEMRSLAGLSRSVAQDFTRHVQPLLMNKCASAGCHGGTGKTGFQLVSAHRGTNPLIAERNLAAVLSQIDLSDPELSPILAVTAGAHGNSATPLFRGRAGAAQVNALRSWVLAASDDIAPYASRTQREGSARPVLTRASHTQQRSAEMPHGRERSTAESDETLLEAAHRANADDPFNPDEFNQKYHPGRMTAVSPNSDPLSSSESGKRNVVEDRGTAVSESPQGVDR